MKRTLAALAVSVVAMVASPASPAQAHAVACNGNNSHYRDVRAHNKGVLKKIILVPEQFRVRCSTVGKRTFVLRLVGPCTTYYQIATVLKESKIGPLNWSTTWLVTGVRRDGFNRCKPR